MGNKTFNPIDSKKELPTPGKVERPVKPQPKQQSDTSQKSTKKE